MILSGAEPFLLSGSSKGVLLIHGFTGSPSEMVLLGEYLYKQGYTVLGVRLAGHGTNVEEMAITNWQELVSFRLRWLPFTARNLR